MGKVINAEHIKTSLAEKSAEKKIPLGLSKPMGENTGKLKNVIREAVHYSLKEIINPEHLKTLTGGELEEEETPLDLPLKEAVKLQEIKSIKHALKVSNGNRDKAAALLEISSRSLYAKLKEYGIGKVEG